MGYRGWCAVRVGLRNRVSALALLLCLFCVLAHPCAGAEFSGKGAPRVVTTATLGEDGRVQVRWSDGGLWVAPRERGQAGVERIEIAADHETVGWTVERDACCQSYPIPMVLVLARNGRILHRVEVGQGIFNWCFEEGGRRFALFHDTSHGNLSPTCELYDTVSGRQLKSWQRGETAELPEWAKPFAEDVGPLTTDGQP